MKPTITFEHFTTIDIRTGTIVNAEPFHNARKPAYKLLIDFGNEIGQKRSSAQITELYGPEKLIGQQVIAVINLAPKKIANYISECLVLGVHTTESDVVLLVPERTIENGLIIS